MGLLSILKKVKEKEREVRILILGLDNAGKTTIVKKLCGQPIDTIEPTLGFQIESLEYQNYHLNLWDIGGQSSIRAYWRNYFEQTDGLVWVVDSADLSRLHLVRSELENLLQQERLAGATLLIWANKQDIAGSVPPSKIVEALGLEGVQFQNRHWAIHPCSAVTGNGLMEGMDWLIEDISNRIFMLS
mmetsp:Transcript_25373/g.62446  ORF Transcript_25373/g.62446 Transcript_25373/m.62446 type:complete len:187 (+) Transcript_25373:64-624(+)